jgi:hypothetical protein
MADKEDEPTEDEKEEGAGEDAAVKAYRKVGKEAMDVKREQDAAAGDYTSSAHDNAEVRKRAAKAMKEGRTEGKSEYRNKRLMEQLKKPNPLYDNDRSPK